MNYRIQVPQLFIALSTLDSILHGVGLALLHCKKWIIPRFTFQLYTRLNDLKFNIPKMFLERGSPESPPPPQTPPPAPSRAFGLPSTFEAWLRPWVRGSQWNVIPLYSLARYSKFLYAPKIPLISIQNCHKNIDAFCEKPKYAYHIHETFV